MATDIVGSLFGVDPTAYQQSRDRLGYSQDYQAVSLDPIQQANLALRQGGRGLGQVAAGLMGMQDPELAKASQIKQLAGQFDLQTPEGLRQFSSALSSFAPEESIRAAQVADEREKTGLGLRKTKADIEKAELSVAQEEKLRAELSALGPNPSEQAVISVVSKYGSPDKILQVLTASQDRAAARAAKVSSAGGGLGPMTPAQKAVDNKFSKEYNDFVSAGGSSAITKNLQMLDDAIRIIETEPDGATSGKVVGLADKTGTLSYTHPKAAEAKDLIGGVAQSNLRAVLGGQFAAKEGEQLLARAYNTAQPKQDNLNRLKALRKQIEDAAKAKINASQYYEENGTLKGFKGSYSATTDVTTPDNNDPLGLRKK